MAIFAQNLDRPFGIVFRPPGEPHRVYLGAANQVVRIAYPLPIACLRAYRWAKR